MDSGTSPLAPAPVAPGAMTFGIAVAATVASLAGFLFGFDTVVISGAERRIQSLWGLTNAEHGFAIASALYGTVIGALFGSWPTDTLGRRRTLILIGLLYLTGALWSAFAADVTGFVLARAIGGLGIGISTVAAPLYIAEIAPPEYRGRLTGMFQFNIVFGILVAFGSNALLGGMGPQSWRWMLGVAALPSTAYLLLCLALPESPRWLAIRAARAASPPRFVGIRVASAGSPADTAIAEGAVVRPAAQPAPRFPLFERAARRPAALAMLIAFFNQLSGINSVLYFAPRIFELAGLGPRAALFQSLGIGITNLVFTFVGLWLIDRVGRRTLLLVGSVGYIASLSLVSWAFFNNNVAYVPICVFLFIAAHAVGQGAVIWVFIAEIFPDNLRARGQALGSSTHWIFAALLTTAFPAMVSRYEPGYTFAFFAVMMSAQLLWVIFMVPETRGVSFETIQERLGGTQL